MSRLDSNITSNPETLPTVLGHKSEQNLYGTLLITLPDFCPTTVHVQWRASSACLEHINTIGNMKFVNKVYKTVLTRDVIFPSSSIPDAPLLAPRLTFLLQDEIREVFVA